LSRGGETELPISGTKVRSLKIQMSLILRGTWHNDPTALRQYDISCQLAQTGGARSGPRRGLGELSGLPTLQSGTSGLPSVSNSVEGFVGHEAGPPRCAMDAPAGLACECGRLCAARGQGMHRVPLR
jgi:hypothetical protein